MRDEREEWKRLKAIHRYSAYLSFISNHWSIVRSNLERLFKLRSLKRLNQLYTYLFKHIVLKLIKHCTKIVQSICGGWMENTCIFQSVHCEHPSQCYRQVESAQNSFKHSLDVFFYHGNTSNFHPFYTPHYTICIIILCTLYAFTTNLFPSGFWFTPFSLLN